MGLFAWGVSTSRAFARTEVQLRCTTDTFPCLVISCAARSRFHPQRVDAYLEMPCGVERYLIHLLGYEHSSSFLTYAFTLWLLEVNLKHITCMALEVQCCFELF